MAQDKEVSKSKRGRNDRNDWKEYMNSKKYKLHNQFEDSREDVLDESQLFHGISIHVNGLTIPSADELKILMSKHGGRFDMYYSKTKTTYVIATNLAYSKQQKVGTTTILRPEWIVDSIQAKRILPTHSYLLVDPIRSKQPAINFDANVDEDENKCGELDTLRNRVTYEYSSDTNVNSDDDGNAEMISEINETGIVDNIECDVPNSPANELNGKRSLIAGEPGFLEAYFSRSRLHHISTSVNDFKNYVESLRVTKSPTFIGRQKLLQLSSVHEEMPYKEPIVMHVDMDCFFVSVGLVSRPHLKGKPVVVTHAKSAKGRRITEENLNFETSHYRKKHKIDIPDDEIENDSEPTRKNDFNSFAEIACCSYEARSFGVRNGTTLGNAKQRCPDIIPIPYEFDSYSKVSKILYDTVASYSLDIEATSCEELFVDITEVLKVSKVTPELFATELRKEIKEKTDCSASIGIAPNVLLAKMASKKAKPDGQMVLLNNECDIIKFIGEFSVSSLPGVGYSTSAKLKNLFGIETCQQLKEMSLQTLKDAFGNKSGQNLYERCRGVDRTQLKFEQATNRKSVSVEINYGIRFSENEPIFKFIEEISGEVSKRMIAIDAQGQQLTLKVKVRSKDAPVETVKFLGHGVCDNISKSTFLRTITNDPVVIAKQSIDIYKLLKIIPKDLRGVGIHVSKLVISSSSLSPRKMLLEDLFKLQSTKCPSSKGLAVRPGSDRNTPGTSSSTESSRSHDRSNGRLVHPVANDETFHLAMPADFSGIDKETFEMLPFEIQSEIMRSYSVDKKEKKTITTNRKDDKKQVVKKVSYGPIDKLFSAAIKINPNSRKPNLCGETSVDEVNNIIQEWVQTEPELMDEDIAYVLSYLSKLIRNADWTTLKLVGACLYEKILIRDEKLWIDAYNNIITCIKEELSDADNSPSSLLSSLYLIEMDS